MNIFFAKDYLVFTRHWFECAGSRPDV